MSLGNTQKLLLAFVTLILGAVLIGVIASQSIAVTEKQGVVNASLGDLTTCFVNSSWWFEPDISLAACNLTVVNIPTSWKIEDCPIADVSVRNGTADDMTLDTDYTLDAASGSINILNSTGNQGWNTPNPSDNLTYVDYTYCADDYLNLSWGRIVVNLVGGFFAIALLLVSVGLFFDVAKDNNII